MLSSSIRCSVIACLACTLLCGLSTEAAAQDTPYSSKRYTPQELINDGDFSKNPLKLPFTLRNSKPLPVAGRTDFEIEYDSNTDEVVKYFNDAFKAAKILPIIDPKSNNAGASEVQVIGTADIKGAKSFILVLPKSARKFSIEISGSASGTKIVLRNLVFTDIYSGLMPSRVKFKPHEAKPVPFRFN